MVAVSECWLWAGLFRLWASHSWARGQLLYWMAIAHLLGLEDCSRIVGILLDEVRHRLHGLVEGGLVELAHLLWR